MPTKDALVNLTEQPAFVVSLELVDHVSMPFHPLFLEQQSSVVCIKKYAKLTLKRMASVIDGKSIRILPFL